MTEATTETKVEITKIQDTGYAFATDLRDCSSVFIPVQMVDLLGLSEGDRLTVDVVQDENAKCPRAIRVVNHLKVVETAGEEPTDHYRAGPGAVPDDPHGEDEAEAEDEPGEEKAPYDDTRRRGPIVRKRVGLVPADYIDNQTDAFKLFARRLKQARARSVRTLDYIDDAMDAMNEAIDVVVKRRDKA